MTENYILQKHTWSLQNVYTLDGDLFGCRTLLEKKTCLVGAFIQFRAIWTLRTAMREYEIATERSLDNDINIQDEENITIVREAHNNSNLMTTVAVPSIDTRRENRPKTGLALELRRHEHEQDLNDRTAAQVKGWIAQKTHGNVNRRRNTDENL